ncbi:MAG: phytanoyl-CoA dioxygenase family protein [Planctomycetota bacterium]
MGKVFLDDALDEHLFRKGYAVFPLLDEQEIAELRRIFDELGPDTERNFTIDSNSPEYKQKLSQSIERVIGPKMTRMLNGYTFLACNYVVKRPGGPLLSLHQDNAILDETKYTSVNTWIPLHDVDESNGCLTVVPESHLWCDYKRAFGDRLEDSPFRNVTKLLAEKFEKPVPMKGGHALVYHSCTMHGSTPNRTDQMRVVTLSASTPIGAPVIFHHRVSPDEIELFACAEDFYYREMFVFTRPQFTPSLGVHKIHYREPYTEEEFLEMVKAKSPAQTVG